MIHSILKSVTSMEYISHVYALDEKKMSKLWIILIPKSFGLNFMKFGISSPVVALSCL